MKIEAKAAVAKAKNEAYKEWYDKMGTEEGEWMRVCKLESFMHSDSWDA